MKIAIFLTVLVTLGVIYRLFANRSFPKQDRHVPSPSDQLMPIERAAAVLGLTAPYNQQDVIDAHRRLMQKVHPDKGGSVALAQELNEAKRALLRELS